MSRDIGIPLSHDIGFTLDHHQHPQPRWTMSKRRLVITAVLVILFVGYLAGGYVAGRMARFSGAKQGLGVWLWAIVIAIVLAIVSAIAGAQWNVLANLDAFPRLPIGEGELTTVGIVTAVLALVVSLGGAVLGGLAGMRFHRRVDREGLGR